MTRLDLFTSPSCPACPAAREAVASFARSWPDVMVREWDLTRDPGPAVGRGIFATPAILVDDTRILLGVPAPRDLAEAASVGSGARQDRSEDLKDAGRRYRFERLALPLVLGDLYFDGDDPGPGDRLPEFDLPTVGGGRFRSSDLAVTGPALLIFGSITCPVTDNAAPGLNELYLRFADRVRFVMVNVREAHPGRAFPQTTTLDAKTAHAAQLRHFHGFEFAVAVDDVDGTLHRALSPKPNSAYVLGADGTILFRAHWANDTKALAAALDAVVAGESPRRSRSGGVFRPMLRMLRNIAPVLDRAGSGAWADMWRVAPPLAAVALALKALRVRPPKPGRPVAADHATANGESDTQ